MANINTGAGRKTKTIADALAIANNGDVIILDAETFDISATGLKIAKSVTIKSLAPNRAAIRYINPSTDTTKNARDYTAITAASSSIVFEEITFHTNRAWTVTCNRYSNGVTFRRCSFGGENWNGVQLLSGKNVTVEDCTFACPSSYSIYTGGTPQPEGLTVRRCVFLGSERHILRTHGLRGLLVENCEFDNPWDKYSTYHGAAINIRDGENVIVRGCKVNGSMGFGPLPDADNTVWLRHVQVTDCEQHGSYFAIEPNVENIEVRGLRLIDCDQSGNALNIKADPKKAPPTGVVDGVEWSYRNGGGVFCKNQVPSIKWSNIRPYSETPTPTPPPTPTPTPADPCEELAEQIVRLERHIARVEQERDEARATLAQVREIVN